MKKIYFAVISILVLSTSSIHAQDIDREPQEIKRNTFKFGLTNLFANTLMFGYERAIGTRNSVQVYGSFTLNKPNTKIYETIMGFSGEAQYRIYLKPRKLLNGFYVAPTFKYEQLNFTKVDVNRAMNYNGFYDPFFQNNPNNNTVAVYQDAQSNTYMGGVIFGYQLIIADVFLLDFYLGGGMKYTDSNYPLNNGSDDFENYGRYNQLFTTGIAPKLGFKVGVYF